MEQLLSLLVALVLVLSCKGEDWTPPDFCQGQKCPQFEVVDVNQDFEQRSYVATDWITTEVLSRKEDLFSLHTRLKNFCQSQKDAGNEIPTDTWPVLINKTEGAALSLSWFVPPGTIIPANPAVRLLRKPETTYYVRVFSGHPSPESAKDNTKILRDALVKAGKTFDPDTSIGAGYDSLFSPTHHNEIWIPKNE